MALQKQAVTVPVNSQLDTKSDPFLTDAATALSQENVRFQKTGALTKRNGYDLLGNLPGSGINPQRMISDNRQVFVVGECTKPAQQYLGDWQSVAPVSTLPVVPSNPSAQLRFRESISSRFDILNCWSDKYQNYTVYAQAEASYFGGNPQTYSVYISDGQNLRKIPLDIATSTQDISVRAHILIDGTTPVIAIVAQARPNGVFYRIYSIDGETLLSSGSLNAGFFHVATAAYPNRSALVAVSYSATILISTLTAAGTVADGAFTPVNLDLSSSKQYDIVTDGTNTWMSWIFGANLITTEISNTTFLSSWESSDGLGSISSLERIGLLNDGGVVVIAASITVPSGSPRTIIWTKLKAAPRTLTQVAIDYHILNGSRPIKYDGQYFIAVYGGSGSKEGVSPGELRSTSLSLFCSNGSYVINALFATALPQQVFYNGRAFQAVSQIIQEGEKIYFSARKVAAFQRKNTSTYAFSGSHEFFEVNLGNTENQIGTSLNINNSLIDLSGQGRFLDGFSFGQISSWFGPIVSAAPSATGGTILAGTYIYQVVFETHDEQAGVSRSEASLPLTVVTTGSTSSVTLTINTNRMIVGYIAKVYRTTLNGSSPRLISQLTIELGTGTTQILDTNPDANIPSSAPFVYTLGGVLNNTPPRPTIQACVHNDRVFCVAADEPNTIFYSNKSILGELVSFSENLFVNLFASAENFNDKISGCAPYGDKLFVFRENSTYWLAGDGANDLGEGATFTEPELISQDIGCIEPASIITTPVGIFFKSAKGIYLIDGGLSLKYVGAPVEGFNNEEIVSRSLVQQDNLVVFATNNRLLCFDYEQQRWSVDTITGIKAISTFRNVPSIIKDADTYIEGQLFIDSFNPAPADAIQLKLETGWMKLAGIQDFSRIYRLLILGRYFTAHTLTVRVYYDYDTSYVETFTIAPNPSQGIYQFKIHLAKQKCQSLKVEIFDTGSGRSLDLIGMTLEVGMKQGTAKISTARQY